MLPLWLKGFLLLACIFIPLELGFPIYRKPVLRKGWLLDTFYYISGYFIGRLGIALSALIVTQGLSHVIPRWIPEAIANQPIILQLLAAIFIADTGYYFAHRMLHTVPGLWRFHQVHHSVEQMDWLVTVRIHPVDQIVTRLFQMVPLLILGFQPETLAIYASFSAAIAFFIHANIRFDFKLLKWLIATPQFHHWHHINEPEIYHINFAAQLPILDLVFGTFYLPNRKIPRNYGINEIVPNSYLEQVIYPFRNQPKTHV